MEALYILVGVVMGILGIGIFGYYVSKKDNKKFDSSESIKKTVVENSGPVWPEPGYMGAEPMWQSTKIETTFVRGNGKEKKVKEVPLEDQLKEALENEWYEKAAEIRDKINKHKIK